MIQAQLKPNDKETREFLHAISNSREKAVFLSLQAMKAGQKLSIERESFSDEDNEGFIENHFNHGSSLGTTFSLLLAILGSGILTLPSSMHYSGIALGLILLCIGSVFSYFSSYILSLACQRSGKYSYIQLAKEIGKTTEYIVKIIFCINNFGCIVIYTLLVKCPLFST